MSVAVDLHCYYCFDVIIAHLKLSDEDSPEFEDTEYPLFVTWNKVGAGNSSLRGCIGNFSPLSLHSGLKEYAITSALRDPRFPPVTLDEVPQLQCAVSLLTHFEKVDDPYNWEIGKHGVWIDFPDPKTGRSRTGTYLPEVAQEQCWTKDETLRSLIRKAGYQGRVTDSLIGGIRLTRYESHKIMRDFSQYRAWKKVHGFEVTLGKGSETTCESET